MPRQSNGFNMLDVKKKNRSAILHLIHQNRRISRKEIASHLGLTPAAITLITTDLIKEGLLVEATTQPTTKKGRKEILLEINAEKFAAIGVSITRTKFKVMCIDLDCLFLFEDTVSTEDCHNNGGLILDKICTYLSGFITNAAAIQDKKLLGIGVSVLGVVDTLHGISVKSYDIWEDNVAVTEYIQQRLSLPVVLTNNICALAHGETFLTRSAASDNMLFIKYGPGVGCSHLISSGTTSIYDYTSVELGHMIMDSNGRPCICGNQGCLETLVSYDSIEHSIADLISETFTPVLYEILGGSPENLCMHAIMQAYDENEPIVVKAIDRTITYLAIAIKNAITILSPSSVVLYGEPFNNITFKQSLLKELSAFPNTQLVTFSDFNLGLETLGPATVMISYFFEIGGL